MGKERSLGVRGLVIVGLVAAGLQIGELYGQHTDSNCQHRTYPTLVPEAPDSIPDSEPRIKMLTVGSLVDQFAGYENAYFRIQLTWPNGKHYFIGCSSNKKIDNCVYIDSDGGGLLYARMSKERIGIIPIHDGAKIIIEPLFGENPGISVDEFQKRTGVFGNNKFLADKEGEMSFEVVDIFNSPRA